MRKVDMGIGITIGIPTLGRNPVMQWAWAFKQLNPPANFNTRFAQIWNRPIDEARQAMAEQAVKDGSKYLFFLGDDVVVPSHGLKQLIYRMEMNDDLGVVGGIYCMKYDPPYPLVFRGNGKGCYWDWMVGEFFDVTGIGMDCTLIRTEMLKDMPKPWFKTVDTDKFMDAIPSAEQWTEDLYFCQKVCEETDYKIFADAAVMCEHWDSESQTKYVLSKDSKPMQRLQVNKGDKKIIDIGCGPTHWEFHDEGVPIRVDVREEVNPDFRCDARDLGVFGDESFDIVFSSHTLEHIDRRDLDMTLDEWIRIMAKDGELRIIVPDLEWAIKKMTENDGLMNEDVMNVLYGAQTYPENFHKNGFTPARLRKILTDRGLYVAEESHKGYNLCLRAVYLEEAYKRGLLARPGEPTEERKEKTKKPARKAKKKLAKKKKKASKKKVKEKK